MRVQVFDTQQGMHNHLPTTAFPPKEPPLENHLPSPAGPTAAGCRVSLGGGSPSQNPEAAVPRRRGPQRRLRRAAGRTGGGGRRRGGGARPPAAASAHGRSARCIVNICNIFIHPPYSHFKSVLNHSVQLRLGSGTSGTVLYRIIQLDPSRKLLLSPTPDRSTLHILHYTI